MILYNRAKDTYFVFNPAKKRFLREPYDVAWWARAALKWGMIECTDLDMVNHYRDTLQGLDFSDIPPEEAIRHIKDNYPELLV